MAKNVAKQEAKSTVYNGYYDSIQNEPVQIYVSKEPIDSWAVLDYITASGIYSLTDSGSYVKSIVPPENISTMDMATKSVQTDLDLFLYSATIDKDSDGTISIEAETDVGSLLKVGFNIYMPKESKSLNWTQTYQTVKYDSVNFLPKSMELHLYADYKYATGEYQKATIGYAHTYNFDFNKAIQISLPNGVK